MNNWDPGVSEPDRHARAFVIDPTDTSAKVYLEILADPSWRVRKAALARVTEFIRTDGLIEGLVQSLASEDNAGLRNAASDALVRIGEASMDDLRRGLASEDVDQRKLVVEAVGLIGGAEAESALLQAMDDADVNVRASAAEALGRTGGSRAAQHVLAALGRYGSDLQSAAYLLDALAMTHASVPLGQIRGFWNTPALRRSLYPVLGNSRDRDALPLLLEGIVSGSRGNRAAAVLALDVLMDATETSEQVGEALRVSQRSKESVLGLLDYDDDEVVSAAVRILVALELPELAPRILEACACRTNIQVAMDALRSLGSEVVRPLLSDIYRVGIEARVSFLEAVELLGRSSDVAELLEIAEFTELRTAEAAVRAVGRIGDDHAVDGLAELLRRAKSEELEELVAHAIAEVGRR
ncbi:MAG: HEAT repeat domain-containing protein, partial [Myxococcota bacterium]